MTRSRFGILAMCALVGASALSQAAPAPPGRVNASAVETNGRYDRLIVRFLPNSSERTNPAVRQAFLDSAGRGIGMRQLRRLAIGADVLKIERKLGSAAIEVLMQRIAANPRVEYVELDAVRKPIFVPNDTFYAGNQWHYFEPTAGINLPVAWDKSTGTGSVVAVLDTGITPHTDLSANVLAGYDFISDPTIAADGGGRDNDPNDPGDFTAVDQCNVGDPAANSSWHGTHVAGTVAAVTNNAKGVAGVAFNAKVVPLRVLGKCGGFTSDIADAIVWASGGTVVGVPANANPAEVINMSLGGAGSCDVTSQSAINAAVARGTVVVVAAGNDNANASGSAPASCNNVITVGAVGRSRERASYSNYGSVVDVSAPGGDRQDGVASTINTGTTVQAAEGYAGYQGTSMAAPHVAGTIALMQSAHANTPANVESVLKATTHPLAVACPEGCGSGIIDASLAISGASNPILLISDVSIAEGDSGSKLATFTVRLSRPAASTVTYNIATSNGTATAGSDYLASSLTGQSIAAGAISRTFSVTINGDGTTEPAETFSVDVSSVVGIVVADSHAVGTIVNDDVPILKHEVSVTSLSAPANGQLLYKMIVPYGATGLSFQTHSGTGDLDMYVSRNVIPTTNSADCKSEGPSAFENCKMSASGVATNPGTYYVLLHANTAFSGVHLVAGYFIPGLSIADVILAEGNSGTKVMTFTVKLSSPAATTVTYNIATSNGSATAGSDFVASTLTGQTIAAGASSRTFSVTLNGDTTVEANETFTVTASSVSGASVSDGSAIGTIRNDDGPTLSVKDISLSEGNSGTKVATFTVSLSQAAAVPVTYNIATANGSATVADSDYVASTLTGQSIPAGSLSKTFAVTINGDADVEENDRFSVNLSSATGATMYDAQAVGSILNDDGPTLSIADIGFSEGNSGAKVVYFTVKLSQASASVVTYNIATVNGTAVAGSDFVASSLVNQSMAAGVTSKTFAVTLNGDTSIEPNETFNVVLSGAAGATIYDGSALGTIVNDDGPTLSINDVAVAEGNSGTKALTFTVKLSQVSAAPVTYTVATKDLSAVSASDYIASTLTGQTIAAGLTSKTFAVSVRGDTGIEANETFIASVSNATGATIYDPNAIGTITNDD